MKARTKSEAVTLGLTAYNTGKPCVRGHYSDRNLKNRCKECRILLSKERRKLPGHSLCRRITRARNITTYLLASARARCKKTKMEFALTRADVIVPDRCPCCYEEMIVGANGPSLDRLNNDLGYTPNNVRVICRHCNYLKSNLNPDQLRARCVLLSRIANWVETESVAKSAIIE